MTEEDKRDGQSGSSDDENQTGDPGRTPGMAEGDEQTVDEDLREKEKDEQK
ncbi:MAG TPA: hypothetical protein VGN95_25880 [Pyrinomonadaceae bacterium]|jgi:hypothetical protein|nr:hypothetical protein [Pyrinomonadaceae bacterium]